MGEQFELTAATAPQPKAKEQLSSERVQNPHEPEATYASKGKGEQRKEHVGYKVQVAETVTERVLATIAHFDEEVPPSRVSAVVLKWRPNNKRWVCKSRP